MGTQQHNIRKIQQTTRPDLVNGALYSINLPEDAIEQAGLKKGDECEVNCTAKGTLEVKKR